MYLWIGNLETRVQANDEELAWLSEALQFEDGSNSFYMSNGKAGYAGTTQRRFYNYKRKTFPTGLCAIVYRGAQKQGFKVDLVDERQRPAELDPSIDLDWLKERQLNRDATPSGFQAGAPFQYDGVLRVMTRTRGLLWLPTGSGKTEIAVGIMKAVPDLKWLFLAPEADLMYNAARRHTLRTGEDVGLIGDGKYDPDHRVVCATFQTLARRLKNPAKKAETEKLLASFQGVIIDEVHQLPADEFYGVTLAVTNAYYRIGMSGTALARGDKRSMYILAALGEVIYRVAPTDLIDAKWIARPTIRFVPVTQGAPTMKTYVGAYKEKVARSKERNAVVARLAEKAEKPCLVFVKFSEHGNALLKELKSRGVTRVEYMTGKASISQRDAMLDRVKWGDTDIIIATKVLQTGTDIPNLASLVIATAGASVIEALQRIGRGMRVIYDEDGSMIKSAVDVWEIYDKDAKAKNRATGRMRATKMKWFEAHARERMKAYEAEGYPTIMLSAIEATRYGSVG